MAGGDSLLCVNRGDRELDRLKGHLLALSSSLPDLMQRVRAQAASEDRPVAVGDPAHERHRLAAFAAYLQHYGHVDGSTLGPLDMRSVVEQAVMLTAGELDAVARVEARYHEAPLVRASSRQLGQVFVSLLINAAQAIAPGSPATNHVAVELDTTDGGWARVAIADSGSGIAAELLPRIFEPLFSTKRGAGMGIGLAVVREIVEQHGGRISVESEPGLGTLFIIELPPAS